MGRNIFIALAVISVALIILVVGHLRADGKALMNRTFSVTFAAIVIVVGLLFLEGCLFVPTGHKIDSGKDATKIVGAADSDRPLKIGTATRDQIRQAIGIHYWPLLDHSTIYSWTVRDGYWVYPLCFTGWPQSSPRIMKFTFDDAGILRSFEIISIEEENRLRYSYALLHFSTTRPHVRRPCPTAPTSSTN